MLSCYQFMKQKAYFYYKNIYPGNRGVMHSLFFRGHGLGVGRGGHGCHVTHSSQDSTV